MGTYGSWKLEVAMTGHALNSQIHGLDLSPTEQRLCYSHFSAGWDEVTVLLTDLGASWLKGPSTRWIRWPFKIDPWAFGKPSLE